jgi:glycosyltransferase involved in cell wall biosynthesis
MKKIISLTINNFKNDNRVYRMAYALQEWGNEVSVVGLLKGDVQEHENFKGIAVHRMKLRSMSLPDNNKIFGIIKYIELFFKIIFQYRKKDIWHCNDFEAFLIGALAKITRPRLVLIYDCHEYERERNGMPKILRLFVKVFERLLIPLAAEVITVGPSIKKEYERLYGLKNVHLVRNTPHLMPDEKHNRFRETFAIREDQKIFLYQGILTHGRGLDILLETFAQRQTDDAVVVIMGHGILLEKVKQYAEKYPLIFFHPSVPYEQIYQYTSSADVGLNTVQNTSLSYYYCFPNKLFEYIQAQLPILTNDLPDCTALVTQHHIGHVIQEYSVVGFQKAVDQMLSMDLQQFKQSLQKIKPELHWDKEVNEMKKVYAAYLM